MAKLFDKFPTIYYDVQLSGYGYRYLYTNILFRLAMLNEIKVNATAYYEIEIADKDTIEIMAEKVYGDPEYHWLIAYANDMTDPLFDWPMEYSVFAKFLESKYGSYANATQQIHHYECSIERKDDSSQTIDTEVFHVDKATYDDAAAYSYTAWTLDSGVTIEETIRYSAVTAYDYEVATNEAKRSIKVIRKEYLGQIQQEFDNAIKAAGNSISMPYYRSLRAY